MMREIKSVIITHTLFGMCIGVQLIMAGQYFKEGNISSASFSLLGTIAWFITNILYAQSHLRQFRQLTTKVNGQSE